MCSNVLCPSEIMCFGVPKNWIGCEKCAKNIFCCDKCLASEDAFDKYFRENVEKHLLICEGEEHDKKRQRTC